MCYCQLAEAPGSEQSLAAQPQHQLLRELDTVKEVSCVVQVVGIEENAIMKEVTQYKLQKPNKPTTKGRAAWAKP